MSEFSSKQTKYFRSVTVMKPDILFENMTWADKL